jgi:hypothetical protein
MSWLFSRALVAEYSADISLDGAQSALWSGTHTQRASWLPAKTTDAFRLSRSGMTYRPLTDDHGEGVLMSFLAAFPVRTSAQQEKAQELTENAAACGSTWHASLARYDQATSSWKTHQYSLLGDLEPFLETWPRWGMMHAGECWELATPELPTSESESGLWPTPRAQDREGLAAGMRRQSPGLAVTVKMWPTPRSCSAMAATITPESAWADNRFPNLETVVGRAMWPTPNARDWKGAPSDAWNQWSLPREVGGALNPTWVEWLMGWPLGWTDCAALATDKFRKWLSLHGKY